MRLRNLTKPATNWTRVGWGVTGHASDCTSNCCARIPRPYHLSAYARGNKYTESSVTWFICTFYLLVEQAPNLFVAGTTRRTVKLLCLFVAWL